MSFSISHIERIPSTYEEAYRWVRDDIAQSGDKYLMAAAEAIIQKRPGAERAADMFAHMQQLQVETGSAAQRFQFYRAIFFPNPN